jgi:hypothetical protein
MIVLKQPDRAPQEMVQRILPAPPTMYQSAKDDTPPSDNNPIRINLPDNQFNPQLTPK